MQGKTEVTLNTSTGIVRIVLALFSAYSVPELVLSLVKKHRFWIFSQFKRFFGELAYLYSLYNSRLNRWGESYVGLGAIRAQGSQQSPQPLLEIIEKTLLADRGQLMIQGDSGSGKTATLEAATYGFARRALISQSLSWILLVLILVILFLSHVPIWVILLVSVSAVFVLDLVFRLWPLPFLIELRTYKGGQIEEFLKTMVAASIGGRDIANSLHSYVGKRRIIWLVDGVNELKGGTVYVDALEAWRASLRPARSLARAPVVFTTRTGEQPIGILEITDVVTIEELDDDGVREFLRVYGSSDVQRDFASLQEKRMLDKRGLGRNPYWLKMLLDSNFSTSSRGALFERFAKQLIQRELDKAQWETKSTPTRHLPSLVPIEDELELLAELACNMHIAQQVGSSFAEATAELDRKCKLKGVRWSGEDVLAEAEAATLMRFSRQQDRADFVHPLMQEFLVAYSFRQNASAILVHIGDPRWWRPIVMIADLLDQPDSFVRAILEDPFDISVQRLFLGVAALGSTDKPDRRLLHTIAEMFTQTLRMGGVMDWHRRAIWAFSDIAADEISDLLVAALEDDKFKSDIIELMGLTATRRGCDALLRLLGTKYGTLAADALAQMPRFSLEPLMLELRKSDDGVRASAAYALGKIGSRRAIDALVECLASDDYTVKSSAIVALGQIGDARAIGPLIAVLRAGNGSLYYSNAAKALGRIGGSAVEPLLAVLQDESPQIRWRIAEALGWIHDGRAVDPILAMLRSNTRSFTDTESVRVLGTKENTWVLKPLKDDLLRGGFGAGTAARILGLVGDPAAIDYLTGVCTRGPYLVRAYSAEALGNIGYPQAVNVLISTLSDDCPVVRGMAAEALGKIGKMETCSALSEAANKNEGAVKQLMLEAVETIESAYRENIAKDGH